MQEGEQEHNKTTRLPDLWQEWDLAASSLRSLWLLAYYLEHGTRCGQLQGMSLWLGGSTAVGYHFCVVSSADKLLWAS